MFPTISLFFFDENIHKRIEKFLQNMNYVLVIQLLIWKIWFLRVILFYRRFVGTICLLASFLDGKTFCKRTIIIILKEIDQDNLSI